MSIWKSAIKGEVIRLWPVCWACFSIKEPKGILLWKNLQGTPNRYRGFCSLLILGVVHSNYQGILFSSLSISQGWTSSITGGDQPVSMPSYIYSLANYLLNGNLKHTTLVPGRLHRKMRCGTIPESRPGQWGWVGDMLQQGQNAGRHQGTDVPKSPSEVLVCKIALSLSQVVFLLHIKEL